MTSTVTGEHRGVEDPLVAERHAVVPEVMVGFRHRTAAGDRGWRRDAKRLRRRQDWRGPARSRSRSTGRWPSRQRDGRRTNRAPARGARGPGRTAPPGRSRRAEPPGSRLIPQLVHQLHRRANVRRKPWAAEAARRFGRARRVRVAGGRPGANSDSTCPAVRPRAAASSFAACSTSSSMSSVVLTSWIITHHASDVKRTRVGTDAALG